MGKALLKLKVQGVPKKELEDYLQGLCSVGITEVEIEEVADGVICTFDQEEWNGSKTSTGCEKDMDGSVMDDAKLLQQELVGIAEPHWKEIKVTHMHEM